MPRTVAADAPDADATLPIEPALEDGRMVSEEVYWRDYYEVEERHYEWNNGRLEALAMSDNETLEVYLWLLRLLHLYLETRPIAKVLAPDVGFRLALRDGTRVRRPDLAVVRSDNPVAVAPRGRSYRGIYDLCIEALSDLSPADIRRDRVTKKAEYAATGVAEYYIVHRDPRYWSFYTLTSTGRYVPIAPIEGVIHSGVLPGLRFRLRDLEARRPTEALAADPVYSDFVLPRWQADRLRVAAETRRADAEAERAEAEALARRNAERQAAAEAERRAVAERRLQELAARLARLEAQQGGKDGG